MVSAGESRGAKGEMMESGLSSRERWLTWTILGSWALLCSLQWGWLPFMRYGWALNLWAYQPFPVGVLLAVSGLSISIPAVRQALIEFGDGLVGALESRSMTAPVSGAVVFALLWLLSDNELSPDAMVFGGAIFQGYEFIFPDVGTTWIIFSLIRLESAFELTDMQVVRILSCLTGGFTAGLLVSMARRGMLGPTRTFGLAAALLISSGLIRVFAGRVEAYPLLLLAVASYVWLALRYLNEKRGWYLTCLVAGIAVWLHGAAVGLGLSLFFLPRLASDEIPWTVWLGLLVRGAFISAIPSALFFLGLILFGNELSLQAAVARAVEILGGSEAETSTRWWVRGWGGDPSIGTDLVFASWQQLKYLANTAFLLCPSAIPVLLVLFVLKGRQLGRDATLLFLATLCLPLVVYSFALRPFWGPYDWDLFSITALSLILLQGYALEFSLQGALRKHVAVWLVVFQLLFVGAPFLALRFVPLRDAGPFFKDGYLSPEIGKAATPPPPALQPWL